MASRLLISGSQHPLGGNTGPSPPWHRRRLTTVTPWVPCEAAAADPLLMQCPKISRNDGVSKAC